MTRTLISFTATFFGGMTIFSQTALAAWNQGRLTYGPVPSELASWDLSLLAHMLIWIVTLFTLVAGASLLLFGTLTLARLWQGIPKGKAGDMALFSLFSFVAGAIFLGLNMLFFLER